MAVLNVDSDLCIGCALCVEICPQVFEMKENKAWIITPKLLELKEKLAVVKNPRACDTCDCDLVIDSCPVAAISLEKNS
jgi:ferredoxin